MREVMGEDMIKNPNTLYTKPKVVVYSSHSSAR